jgi:Ca2+/Na+ antiporter
MDIIIERYFIIILAIASAAIFVIGRQWEHVITRSMIAVVFVCIVVGVPFENATVNMLIRWLFILILFVEILSWLVRTFTEENKHGRR